MTTRLVVVIRDAANLGSQMPNLPGTVPRASRDRFAFTTTEGGARRRHNFYARHFRPAVARARLP